MTEAAAPRPRADKARGRRRPELYRHGNALVVYEGGRTRELAELVVQQCTSQSIDAQAMPITEAVSEVALGKLYRYTMLFLLRTPPDSTGSSPTSEAFTQVFAEYRGFRPDDLAAVLQAKCAWQVTGGPVYLLVLGSREDLAHPALDPLRHACIKKAVADVGSLDDLLAEYTDHNGYNSEDALLSEAVKHLKVLTDWNISRTALSHIRTIIEAQIKHFNNPAMSAKYRPHPNHELNSLELVLLDPAIKPRNRPHDEHMPSATREEHATLLKRFDWNAADAVRQTIAVIKTFYPDLKRPGNRENTRDNRVAFKQLYDAVMFIDTLPSELLD